MLHLLTIPQKQRLLIKLQLSVAKGVTLQQAFPTISKSRMQGNFKKYNTTIQKRAFFHLNKHQQQLSTPSSHQPLKPSQRPPDDPSPSRIRFNIQKQATSQLSNKNQATELHQSAVLTHFTPSISPSPTTTTCPQSTTSPLHISDPNMNHMSQNIRGPLLSDLKKSYLQSTSYAI